MKTVFLACQMFGYQCHFFTYIFVFRANFSAPNFSKTKWFWSGYPRWEKNVEIGTQKLAGWHLVVHVTKLPTLVCQFLWQIDHLICELLLLKKISQSEKPYRQMCLVTRIEDYIKHFNIKGVFFSFFLLFEISKNSFRIIMATLWVSLFWLY